MGRPFSQQAVAVTAAVAAVELGAGTPPAEVEPTGVLVPPFPPVVVVVAVVAVDEGDSAPGLRAPADDIEGDVAVVGWPPLTRSCNHKANNNVIKQS